MRPFLPVACLLVVAMAACSGAEDPHGLLGGGSATGGGHDAAPEATSSSSGGGSSGAASSSGGGPDAGGVHDSSVADTGSSVDTGSPEPEASPIETGPSPTIISCPPTSCESPSVCCATNTGQGSTPSYKCQAAGKPCSGTSGNGTILSCSSGADCHGGEVCCGDNQNGFYTQVVCQTTCGGPDQNGGQFIQFCDPSAPGCPVGTTCQPSQVLVGLSVCE
ncbi:MAG: hypothetical protein ACRELB_00120 [Polyangiaceae bacterium]